jgi:hypothetical protein
MDEIPRGRGIIAGVMIFAALLILAFWVIWFLVDRNLLASLHTDYYYRFENAFPAADAWLGILLLLATAGLLLHSFTCPYSCVSVILLRANPFWATPAVRRPDPRAGHARARRMSSR